MQHELDLHGLHAEEARTALLRRLAALQARIPGGLLHDRSGRRNMGSNTASASAANSVHTDLIQQFMHPALRGAASLEHDMHALQLQDPQGLSKVAYGQLQAAGYSQHAYPAVNHGGHESSGYASMSGYGSMHGPMGLTRSEREVERLREGSLLRVITGRGNHSTDNEASLPR